jgi:hypothetical protein
MPLGITAAVPVEGASTTATLASEAPDAGTLLILTAFAHRSNTTNPSAISITGAGPDWVELVDFVSPSGSRRGRLGVWTAVATGGSVAPTANCSNANDTSIGLLRVTGASPIITNYLARHDTASPNSLTLPNGLTPPSLTLLVSGWLDNGTISLSTGLDTMLFNLNTTLGELSCGCNLSPSGTTVAMSNASNRPAIGVAMEILGLSPSSPPPALLSTAQLSMLAR